MKNRLINLLRFIIPLVLAIGMGFWLFTQISFAELMDTFRKADYRWFYFSSVCALVAHLSRAYRWKLVLRPLGYDPPVLRAFMGVMIGYFANFAIPRIGEVARCGVLQSTDKVPVQVGLGTVVAERLIDLVMLTGVLGFTFLLEFGRLRDFFLGFAEGKLSGYQALLDKASLIAAILAVFVSGGIWLFFRFRKQLMQVPLLAKLIAFAEGVWAGVISIFYLKDRWAYLFHTLLIWVMYYFANYLLFFSFPQTAVLDWRAGFVIFTVGAFGMAAPVQGGIGAFHLLVGQALVFYGLEDKDGILLASFLHASQMVLLLVVGALCSLAYLVLVWMQRKQAGSQSPPDKS
jgi:uncharacterized membrane protein YbhN (UPF0104 family)